MYKVIIDENNEITITKYSNDKYQFILCEHVKSLSYSDIEEVVEDYNEIKRIWSIINAALNYN